MAISAAMQWWVRIGGNNLNGGGFDSTVSGAGTNYANQDAPQLSLTDFASVLASTTLTSATGGFTAAMVGNAIRIASGTNFVAGYYVVTGYTNSNTVTIDRACTSGGNGSAGVGRLGGGFGSLFNFVSGGTVTQPVIATPIVTGNTVNVQGSSDTPSSADYAAWGSSGQYSSIFAGSSTGTIKLLAFGGRPWVEMHGMFYNMSHCHVDGFYFKRASQYVSPAYGLLHEGTVPSGSSGGGSGLTVHNCVFDCGGSHSVGFAGSRVINCTFKNSGPAGTSENTYPAIWLSSGAYGGGVFYTDICNWVGKGIDTAVASCTYSILQNNIHHNTGDGVRISANSIYPTQVLHNSIYSNGGDGLVCQTTSSGVAVRGNILYANGGYGLRHSGTNPNQFIVPNRNAFGANTSGPRINVNAGDDDITLMADPFANLATGDCSLNSVAGGGALCRGASQSLRIGAANYGVTEVAGNIGAWQGSNATAGVSGFSLGRLVQ